MTFINSKNDTQEQPQEDTQEHTQDDAQEDTQELLTNVRTQGRKGQKKPRINLAFDSEEFLKKIRIRADKDNKSITQLVNEAVAYYLQHTKPKKGGK